MTAINSVGNSLTGSTGTGAFLGSNTPTLITPVLGVSSATSINFGGGALSSYIPKSTFTPVFEFVTPGDLSVSYATQVGYYVRKGDKIYVMIKLVFTPTYTTSTGQARISGLPVAVGTVLNMPLIMANLQNTLIFTGVRTQLTANAQSGSTVINPQNLGSTTPGGLSTMTIANFLTTIQYSLRIEGFYFV
jgi:hypothetical protein